MDGLFSLVTLLIPISIIAAIVYGIVSLTRRRQSGPQADPGIGTIRRLYFYGVALAALMMAANGIALVGDDALAMAFGDDVVVGSVEKLALGLALTLVGIPLWGVHWWFVRKYMRQYPVERLSVVRKIYVYVILGSSATIAAFSAIGVLHWLMGTERFDGGSLARVVVFGAIWGVHWWMERSEQPTTPETKAVRRIYLYAVAAGSLGVAATGLGQVLAAILGEGYDALTSSAIIGGNSLTGDGPRDAIALVAVMAPIWAMHWLVFAKDDIESLIRQLYLYPYALLGGVITVLTSIGIVLYGVLVWLFGVPEEPSTAAHFSKLTAAVASLIVGGLIVIYHAYVSRQEIDAPVDTQFAPQKSYLYAMTALGIAGMVAAIGTIVVVVISLITASGEDTIAGADELRNAIALAITFGAIGTPLWGYYWRRIQGALVGEDPAQRNVLPRRVFIFAVLGIGMLALLGSVSTLAFVLFTAILEGTMSEFLGNAQGAIAVLTPVAIFMPYYWLVYREDRRLAPDDILEKRPRKDVSVLVMEGSMEFVTRLEGVLGYQVTPLLWADDDAMPMILDDTGYELLADRIGAAQGREVILIPEPEGIRVLSHE
jgi:hypothetical protein